MAVEQVETAAAAPKTGSKMTQYSKTGKMVMEAIETLNEKKGSSIMKIRNYITTQNPELDMTRYGKLVKKFILSALEKGDLTNNDDTKGIRGYFKIAPELKKKNKKALKESTSSDKASTSKDKSSSSKEKGSKSASSPKVKKPVSKTVKLPSAVVATTIKKKKKSTKASTAEAEKESVTKSKKKATVGTKRGKKTEDEAPVPKKKAKKEAEKPKAKAKPKPKKAKSVESETDAKADEPEEAVNDVSEVDENVEPEEAVEKVARGKGKKKDEVKKPKKVAAAKKKKAGKVDDENKEE